VLVHALAHPVTAVIVMRTKLQNRSRPAINAVTEIQSTFHHTRSTTNLHRTVTTGLLQLPISNQTYDPSKNRLPVGQFTKMQNKDHNVDLAMYACAVQYDLRHTSISDLLKPSSTAAKYRMPYLLERFN